jgi:hypothetical protein
MPFQSSVFINMGAGVQGDIFADQPKIGQTYTLVSALASYNIVGATCYTITSQGIAQAGSGGTLGFAGFLANSKVYPLANPSGSPLAPTMTLPNQAIGELITQGAMWVFLPNTANIGDLIVYDNTTGAIESISPITDLPGGKTFANATVAYYSVTVAGLAVIQISTLLPTPA